MDNQSAVLNQPSVQTPQPAQKPRVQTILLVEDDPLLSRMYQTKFTKEGYRVLLAEDGEAGLKIALEQRIDFLILDIMMPKLSGLDLLAKLRENPRGKTIPVIVLSNLAQQKEAEKALALGAKEFLIKANLTPSQVSAKVKQYLGS